METEMVYTRKQLELMKGRAQLAETALKVGAKTTAKMTNAALIEAILDAQKAKKKAKKAEAEKTNAPSAEHAGEWVGDPPPAEAAPAGKKKRKKAERAVKHDADGQVLDDTGNVAPLPDDQLGDPPPPPRFNTPEEAYADIAQCSISMTRAVESLAGVRKDLNNEVKQARASHAGSIESGVDYKDHAAVRAKLENVTVTWQHLQDCEEKRRQELIPYREAVQAARKRYKESIDGAKQLKLFK